MAHDACTLWQAAAEVSATHAAHTSTATAWVRKEFTDVLAAQLLPAQQEADPRSAAAMRMTCRAWACVARAVAWPFVRAHLWGAADMRSLASWLRTHPHVHRLHISTQSSELGTAERDAAGQLLRALPLRALSSLQLNGAVALPMALARCCASDAVQQPVRRLTLEDPLETRAHTRGPLERLSVCGLPGKFTYEDGMFPWHDDDGDDGRAGGDGGALTADAAGPSAVGSDADSGGGTAEPTPASSLPEAASPSATAAAAAASRATAAAPAAAVEGQADTATDHNYESIAHSVTAWHNMAVWKRFASYWVPWHDSLHQVLLTHGAALQELDIEAPDRCLMPNLITLLSLSRASPLRELRLRGFGSRAVADPHLQRRRAGLALHALPLLTSLTRLELIACGSAPLQPDVLEQGLSGLVVLKLQGSMLRTHARPPRLNVAASLTELSLVGAKFVDEDCAPWHREAVPLELPTTLCSLDLTDFRDLVTPDLSGMSLLTHLGGWHPRHGRTSSAHALAPYEQLLELKTCRSGLRDMVRWSNALSSDSAPGTQTFESGRTTRAGSVCVPRAHGTHHKENLCQLASLYLTGCEPQAVCKLSCCGSALTRLQFGRFFEGEDCSGCNGSSSSSSDVGSESNDGDGGGISGRSSRTFSNKCGNSEGAVGPVLQPGVLPALLELHLTGSADGYCGLDLRGAVQLSTLVIDNCEYVDLETLRLPASIEVLSLACFYGLLEMYALDEGRSSEEDSCSCDGRLCSCGIMDCIHARDHRLKSRMHALLESLVQGLPGLHTLHTYYWDVLCEGQAALCAPALRELSMQEVHRVPDSALDALDAACPCWECLLLSRGKLKYIQVARGMRIQKLAA